jgi:hypothetical protein
VTKPDAKLPSANKFHPKILEISSTYSLPLRWGRVRVGVDKIDWLPLPFIPSHGGEGRLLENSSKNVRDKFSDSNVLVFSSENFLDYV